MRKFSLCILLTLICSEIILSTDVDSTNSEVNSFLDSEFAKNVVASMGIDKKEEITKKEFETLFFRILSREEADPQKHNFFTSITKKLSEGMPDKINRDEITSYMSRENIIKAVEDTVREQFGEQYVNTIRETMSKVFEEEKSSTLNDDQQEEHKSKISQEL
jgi:hypothetical protein